MIPGTPAPDAEAEAKLRLRLRSARRHYDQMEEVARRSEAVAREARRMADSAKHSVEAIELELQGQLTFEEGS